MQYNIDNESTTSLAVPAIANVLPAPPVSAKRPHANVGDESTNHHTNQDIDTSGFIRPKKERLPRTNLGLFHLKPGGDQGLFPRLNRKLLCNNFCMQGRVCDKLPQISKFAHVASWKQHKKEDQEAILKHADKTGNIWLDEATFKNKKVEIPQKYQHLLGDAKGPKPKVTKSA